MPAFLAGVVVGGLAIYAAVGRQRRARVERGRFIDVQEPDERPMFSDSRPPGQTEVPLASESVDVDPESQRW